MPRMATDDPSDLLKTAPDTQESLTPSRAAPTSIATLAAIPEEQIWLAQLRSQRTRDAYRRDVRHFMATIGISSLDELRAADHRAVIAWEAVMREGEQLEASTIRRRLAALSSLFAHLVRYGVAATNPVRDIQRPSINRREGKTLAFSQRQARAILDAPPLGTVQGLRDRAMLAVGFQVGLRRRDRGSQSRRLAPEPWLRCILGNSQRSQARFGCRPSAGDSADSRVPAHRRTLGRF